MGLFKKTSTVKARDVQRGDVYVSSPTGGDGERRFGRLPRVTRTNHLEEGEGGQPTVYIETSEAPGVFWFAPDETLTVRTRRR